MHETISLGWTNSALANVGSRAIFVSAGRLVRFRYLQRVSPKNTTHMALEAIVRTVSAMGMATPPRQRQTVSLSPSEHLYIRDED